MHINLNPILHNGNLYDPIVNKYRQKLTFLIYTNKQFRSII